MGLLDATAKKQLCRRLEELPGAATDWSSVRAALLKGLPAGVVLNIRHSPIVRADIINIVDTVEGPGMQLPDGQWPATTVIQNAIDLSAGLLLEQKLQELLMIARTRLDVRRAEGVDLEALLNQHAGFQRVEQWAGRLNEVIAPICVVEVGGRPYGTGFLVAPDLVLTNFHVTHWQDGADWTPFSPQQIRVRFDYHLQSAMERDESLYEIVDERLPSSPFAELDFALLRVKGKPADEVSGGLRGAAPRGYLRPSERPLHVGEPLFIIQHPRGRPMEIAFDLVTDVQPSRVLYRTNTEPGSSGSPCFDKSWELVGLHHAASGDRTANQAIPVSLIFRRPEVRELLR